MRIRQEHDDTVHADPQSACWRHTCFQGTHEFLIDHVGFIIPKLSFASLLVESLSLNNRIIQL